MGTQRAISSFQLQWVKIPFGRMTVIGCVNETWLTRKYWRKMKGQMKIAEDIRIYANHMWIISPPVHHPKRKVKSAIILFAYRIKCVRFAFVFVCIDKCILYPYILWTCFHFQARTFSSVTLMQNTHKLIRPATRTSDISKHSPFGVEWYSFLYKSLWICRIARYSMLHFRLCVAFAKWYFMSSI